MNVEMPFSDPSVVIVTLDVQGRSTRALRTGPAATLCGLSLGFSVHAGVAVVGTDISELL